MKTVHKVCSYILQDRAVRSPSLPTCRPREKCKECPAWETVKGHGKGKSGCRYQAEEIINVVKYGNPWGKKYRRSRASWPDRSKFTTRETE